MENVKWVYLSKVAMGHFLKNYTDVDAMSLVLDSVEIYGAKIAEYKKNKKKGKTDTEGSGGGTYARLPLFMLYEDYGVHQAKLGYSYETHGLLVAVTMLLSTYVSRGIGIKSSTLQQHFGHNLFVFRDLIEAYGRPYCLKWHYEYDPKQCRNKHYVTFNEELLQIKSIEAGGMK